MKDKGKEASPGREEPLDHELGLRDAKITKE